MRPFFHELSRHPILRQPGELHLRKPVPQPRPLRAENPEVVAGQPMPQVVLRPLPEHGLAGAEVGGAEGALSYVNYDGFVDVGTGTPPRRDIQTKVFRTAVAPTA